MTLEEVKASIEASIKARDIMYEHTPANYALLSKGRYGKTILVCPDPKNIIPISTGNGIRWMPE